MSMQQTQFSKTSLLKNLSIFFSKVAGDFFYSYKGKIQSQNLNIYSQCNSKPDSLKQEPSISLISHELKSPIASIVSITNLINDGDLSDSEIKMFLKDIENLALDSLDFIDDLLDVSTEDISKLNMSYHHPYKLIKSSVRIVKGLALRDGIQIFTNIEDNLPLLNCDCRKIKQILVNLLTNAIKYSPYDSNIEISAKEMSKKLYITIKDNGMGMTSEELNNLYNIHQIRKVDNSYQNLNKKLDSHGIGLPLVKKMIDLHDGNIEFYSAGRNKGLEVNVSFSIN